MDYFQYRDGQLWCEQQPVAVIAAELDTPLYVYSQATLIHHYHRLVEAFSDLDLLVCYSVKSCHNLSICRLLKEQGAGFDVVSGGELYRALRVGADPQKILYAGVGKSDREIQEAIGAGIGWFNVESDAEMQNLIRLTSQFECPIKAALRVNPEVEPDTHIYTATGKRESKFGVDIAKARGFFEKYRDQRSVRLSGVHMHIGSPVNSIQPYIDAITKTLALIDDLIGDGNHIEMLDIGGGFGAFYESGLVPSAADYAYAISPLLRGRNLQVVIQPGRSITANAGILLTRVLYTKVSGDKHFVIVDAGMNDLLRPALYGAYHFVWPVSVGDRFVPYERGSNQRLEGLCVCDVVGPVCESGDFLAKGRSMPPVKRGDLLAIFSSGAYGFVMSSQYNSRPRSAEILVDGNQHRVIRQRETYEQLIWGEE